MTTNTPAIRSLEILDTFIAIHVRSALQAAIVTNAASYFFVMKQGSFALNPANTLTYSALRAVVDRSIVTIAEFLRDEHHVIGLTHSVRRRAEMLRHRDAISHPATVQWRRREMQQFFDADRHFRDIRPALIWDLQRSINEHLASEGRPIRTNDISATVEMAMLLDTILRLSASSGFLSAIPVVTDLRQSLSRFARAYLDFLVDHPDGQ